MNKYSETIKLYSKTSDPDLVYFHEQVLFSFLTGNADIHLKIYQAELGPVLILAYDLVKTAIVNPSDEEQMALTLNGKKQNKKS